MHMYTTNQSTSTAGYRMEIEMTASRSGDVHTIISVQCAGGDSDPDGTAVEQVRHTPGGCPEWPQANSLGTRLRAFNRHTLASSSTYYPALIVNQK